MTGPGQAAGGAGGEGRSGGGRLSRLFRGKGRDEETAQRPGASPVPPEGPQSEHPPAPGSLFEVELDPAEAEAQRRREAEAAAIQLARERALAEEREREAEERRAAEAVARAAALSRLTLWTDTHCHLQHADGSGPVTDVIDRALNVGVRRMICVGVDEPSSRDSLDLAIAHSTPNFVEIFATAGLHPHEAKRGVAELEEFVTEALADPRRARRLVAIGECGLDFYYDHSPRDAQREAFAAQIELANRYDLALVIHTRDAFDATLGLLSEVGTPARTIFHCFTGGREEAERCLETGGYLSFSGIATFASAAEVRESARLCPPDRLLIETDSPYLTPVPHRGRPNEPAYVSLVGEALARERGMRADELASLTSENAVAAFRLPVA